MRIPFHTPTLDDRAVVCRAANAAAAMENDAAFASIYLLRHKYRTEIAVMGEALLRRYHAGIRADCYGFPLGGDLRASIALLAADARISGMPLRLGLLTQEMCDALADCYPGGFVFTPAAGYTEYLYLRQNLAEMKGSRYHGKRNHISQFQRANPEAEIQPLIAENAEFAVEIARGWLTGRSDSESPSLQAELQCICEAAEHWNALGLSGLLLYAQGQPIGMTIVSEISQGVVDVHFEKVIPAYPHAWPVVAQSMARCLPQAKYLNREEDLGEDGMRASKTSYHPDLLREKFFAQWVGTAASLRKELSC